MNNNEPNLSKREKWLLREQAVVMLAAVLAAVSSLITLLLIAARSKERKLPVQPLEGPKKLGESLHLSWDADPLSVRLVESESESERWVPQQRLSERLSALELAWADPLFTTMIVLQGFLMILAMVLVLKYAYGQSFPPATQGQVVPVSISLGYPTYASQGEESQIDVTLTNRDAREITCTATIVFTSPLQIVVPLGESTTLHFGNLKSGELRTQRVQFSIPGMHIFPQLFNNEELGFRLRLEMEDGRKEDLVGNWAIRIAPLPRMKTFTQSLGIALLVISSFLALRLMGKATLVQQIPDWVKAVLPAIVSGLFALLLFLLKLEFE